MVEGIEFLPFSDNHADAFKSLNEEWLSRHFEVEPYDHKVLSLPNEEILNQGGFIFMVKKQNRIIGTFAFLKKEQDVFEFSKMAVTSGEQGNGIGNKMMQFAIRFAEQHHWKKVILYSNTKLQNAIYLYRKYGFIEVAVESDVHYARCNIKMELCLKN